MSRDFEYFDDDFEPEPETPWVRFSVHAYDNPKDAKMVRGWLRWFQEPVNRNELMEGPDKLTNEEMATLWAALARAVEKFDVDMEDFPIAAQYFASQGGIEVFYDEIPEPTDD